MTIVEHDLQSVTIRIIAAKIFKLDKSDTPITYLYDIKKVGILSSYPPIILKTIY